MGKTDTNSLADSLCLCRAPKVVRFFERECSIIANTGITERTLFKWNCHKLVGLTMKQVRKIKKPGCV